MSYTQDYRKKVYTPDYLIFCIMAQVSNHNHNHNQLSLTVVVIVIILGNHGVIVIVFIIMPL